MGIHERIKAIEHELSMTQCNKATSTHIGMLKSQLSRLRNGILLYRYVDIFDNFVTSAAAVSI